MATPVDEGTRQDGKRRYGEEVVPLLKALWEWTDQLGSKHLVAALLEWLPYYEERIGSIDLPPKIHPVIASWRALDLDQDLQQSVRLYNPKVGHNLPAYPNIPYS